MQWAAFSTRVERALVEGEYPPDETVWSCSGIQWCAHLFIVAAVPSCPCCWRAIPKYLVV